MAAMPLEFGPSLQQFKQVHAVNEATRELTKRANLDHAFPRIVQDSCTPLMD